MNITTTVEDEGVEYTETMSFRYIYNNNGQLHKLSLFLLSEGSEILFMEFEFIFDNSGRRIASEFSSLSFENFEFGKTSRTEYEYNAEVEVTLETTSMWNVAEEKWETANKSEHTYTNLNYSEVAFPSYQGFFIEPEEGYTQEWKSKFPL